MHALRLLSTDYAQADRLQIYEPANKEISQGLTEATRKPMRDIMRWCKVSIKIVRPSTTSYLYGNLLILGGYCTAVCVGKWLERHLFALKYLWETKSPLQPSLPCSQILAGWEHSLTRFYPLAIVATLVFVYLKIGPVE